jgi:hypothetical protein
MKFLTEVLEQKIVSNNGAIETLQDSKVETQENIDLFSSPCTNVDSKIVSITAEINTLQQEIVSLSTNAYAVGCGTTVGVTTVYPDVVRVYSENISNSAYDGDDPFDSSNTILVQSNAGIGTYLVYTQSDSSQTGIGSLYGDLSNCYGIPCTSSVCVSHASSITSRQNQIISLRSQLNSLVTGANQVKSERREYEIERYAHNSTVRILGEENTRIRGAIEIIKTYP